MIPQQLLDLITGKKEFQSFLTSIGKDVTPQTMPYSAFEQLATIISDDVGERIEAGEASDDDVTPGVISGKTLYRYFKGAKDPASESDPRRLKKLNSLLIYTQVPREQWKDYYKKGVVNDVINKHMVTGYWNIYAYEGRDLFLTRIHVYYGAGGALTAAYRSVHNVVYNSGQVTISDHIITITFTAENEHLSFVAYMDAKALGEGRILNGMRMGVSQFVPYAIHCVLTFGSTDGPDLNAAPPKKVVHTTEASMTGSALSDLQTDPIVVYLARKRQKVAARPFEVANLSCVTMRNEKELGALPAANILQSLSGWWYQLNRLDVPGYGTAYCRIFFSQKENKWRITCHNSSGARTGKAQLIGNTLIADFQMEQHQPEMRISLRVTEQEIGSGFLSGLCFVNINAGDGNVFASRIFLAKRQQEPAGPPLSLLSDEGLLATDETPDEAKFFLAEEPALRHESGTRRISGKYFEEVSVYAGDYFLFLPNTYNGQKGLFRLCLSLDRFGGVSEQFNNSHDSPDNGRRVNPFSSYGRAELRPDGLHVFAVNKSDEITRYLFGIDRRRYLDPPFILQGINLDSDRDKRPCADACIALRRNLFPPGTEYKPGIIQSGSAEYEALERILGKFLKIDINKYYYEMYPSIRFHSKRSKPGNRIAKP